MKPYRRFVKLVSIAFVVSALLVSSGFISSVTQAAPLQAPGDQAGLDSQSSYPTVNGGYAVNIWIKVRNEGTNIWWANGQGGYGWSGRGQWSGRGGGLWRNVPPGDELTFQETVYAPYAPGTYYYGFLITRYGSSIGPYFYIQVKVKQPAPIHTRDIRIELNYSGCAIACSPIDPSRISSSLTDAYRPANYDQSGYATQKGWNVGGRNYVYFYNVPTGSFYNLSVSADLSTSWGSQHETGNQQFYVPDDSSGKRMEFVLYCHLDY